MAGLYIHIPFCASRCIYCGFYSCTHLSYRDKYIDAVCKEIKQRSNYLSVSGDNNIDTIYIGGGTPSLLSSDNWERLFNEIHHTFGDKATETTIECNPDDITNEYARTIARYANRVSMGAQTFSEKRLRLLRRRHNATHIRTAVSMLRDAGINNISIDLMFGFPDETVEDWRDDINQTLDLGVEHISGYSLMYEEGTALYDMLRKGSVKQIDEELSREMYSTLIDMLTDADYEHYEISNFARAGFRSRHNSSYWNDTPYIGIGAAAHSYNLRSRQWNVSDINTYIDNTELDKPCYERECIDEATHYNDIITTKLRTCEGIDLSKLEDKYKNYLLSNAQRFIDTGMILLSDNYIIIARNGLYTSDDIMSELVWV